jgi:hypothetical protein
MIKRGWLTLALWATMLLGCQLNPTVDATTAVGCHSKHINCQRFDYRSLTQFNASLMAHMERWNLNVPSRMLEQIHAKELPVRTTKLASLADYIEAINQRPGDIFLLVKQAREKGFNTYETFLMEQAFLRSIIDLSRLNNS